MSIRPAAAVLRPSLTAAFVAVALTACWTGPERIPFRGPPPSNVMVLPLRADDLPPALRAASDDSVHLALQDRGYRSVPPAVAANMLDSLDLESTPVEQSRQALAELAERFEVDAVLVREARLASRSTAADDFVVRWDIYATADGRRIWSHTAGGGPDRPVGRLVTGPQSTFEDDPFLSDENLLAREMGGATTVVRPRDVREQAADVQWRIAERLPRAR